MERYFTSPEPLSGDPSLLWEDFREPRLRRFPEPIEHLSLGRYLGCGIDGVVLKARVRGRTDPLAVKIVRRRLCPFPLSNLNCIQFHFGDRPPPVYGATSYWAFERECINRALLDMITASLRQAALAGRQIYVRPRPAKLSHARDNLRAFCQQAVTRPQPQGFIPIESDPQLVGCLGWTEFKGSKINEHFRKARVPQEAKVDDESYVAIVYQFVEEDTPDLDRIDSQVDFFHLAGFMIDRFNPNNWLGKGVLVDFSDVIPHHTGHRWWRPAYYAQQELGFCRIPAERALEQRLLGPRPKWEPIQTGLRRGQRASSFLPAPSRRVRDGEVIPAPSPPTEKAPPVSGDQPVDDEDEADAEEGFETQKSKHHAFPRRDPALGLSRQQRPPVQFAGTSSIR